MNIPSSKLVGTWLAVDFSDSQSGGFALLAFDGSEITILNQKLLTKPFSQSEEFISTLDSAFKDTKLTLLGLAGFIVNRGPGSFTGLRVAMASIKAMAAALKKPILAIEGPTVRALHFAHAVQKPGDWSHLAVWTSLAKGQWQLSCFQNNPLTKTLSELRNEFKAPVDGTVALVLENQAELIDGKIFSQVPRPEHLGLALKFPGLASLFETEKETLNLTPEYYNTWV